MAKKMVAGIILTLFIILLIAVIVGLSSSMSLDVQKFAINSSLGLSQLKIVHLSDIHYPNNGVSLSSLVSEINYISPHIIVLTGDVFDKSATKQDVANFEDFFKKLSNIATVFAVIGNHEIGSDFLGEFYASCDKSGITVLNNDIVYYNYADSQIALIGLKDGYSYNDKNLPKLKSVNKSATKILLAHRCEKFDNYSSDENKPNYVFAGHAHGGQIRMFEKGFYAPNQGLFPKYTSGLYQKNDCAMFVSRGLGDSESNLRWFNKYHMIVVEFS